MQRIAGFVLVAVIAAALAWWASHQEAEASCATQYPQSISYTVRADVVTVRITTPRYDGESAEEWIARTDAAYATWEATHGEAVFNMGDGSWPAVGSPGEGDH